MAADHAVRDTGAGKRLLDRVALSVHAVEDGEIREIAPCRYAVEDGFCDEHGFVTLARRGMQDDAFALGVLRPEGLALALGIILDNVVRRVEDGSGTAVILLQTDDDRALELVLKGEDVLDGRAAEAVDALVVVADHAEVAVPAGKQADQAVLALVGVLILVDHDILEAILVVFEHVGILLKEFDSVVDQVVEVHRVGGQESLLVHGVALSDIFDAAVIGRDALDVLRLLHLVLVLADLVEHRLMRQELFIYIELFEDFLHQSA